MASTTAEKKSSRTAWLYKY